MWAAATTGTAPVSLDAGTWSPTSRRLVVQDSSINPTRILEIWLDASVSVLPARIDLLSEEGHFTSCGAYVEPFAATLTPPGLPVRGELEPGEVDDYSEGIVRTRVLLGRTERVIVAPSSCEPGRSSLNDHFDLLTLRTPEGI
jgi:hypothetical protein